MKNALQTAVVFSIPVALLAGFHFWGEWQRQREWWWLAGDKDGMTFLDLSSAESGHGHLLSTYALKQKNNIAADEFRIEWNCKTKVISWLEVWTLDDEMLQIERRTSPDDMSKPHSPRSANEKRILSLACSSMTERADMQTLRAERPPIQVTRLATKLVSMGVKPFSALLLASYDPKKDELGYERIVLKGVEESKRGSVRRLVGASNE